MEPSRGLLEASREKPVWLGCLRSSPWRWLRRKVGRLGLCGTCFFWSLVHLSDAQPVPAGVRGTTAGKGSLISPSLYVQPTLETSQITGHEGLVQPRPLHQWPIGGGGSWKGHIYSAMSQGCAAQGVALSGLAFQQMQLSLCWEMSPRTVPS